MADEGPVFRKQLKRPQKRSKGPQDGPKEPVPREETVPQKAPLYRVESGQNNRDHTRKLITSRIRLIGRVRF